VIPQEADMGDGPVKGGAVSARLAAGDDSLKHSRICVAVPIPSATAPGGAGPSLHLSG
jgi:hypothetical protein